MNHSPQGKHFPESSPSPPGMTSALNKARLPTKNVHNDFSSKAFHTPNVKDTILRIHTSSVNSPSILTIYRYFDIHAAYVKNPSIRYFVKLQENLCFCLL